MARPKRRHPAVQAYLSELGQKGGRARAEALSPQQRRKIAQEGGKALQARRSPEERRAAALKAIRARWSKAKDQ
jgi:hypothetical protein